MWTSTGRFLFEHLFSIIVSRQTLSDITASYGNSLLNLLAHFLKWSVGCWIIRIFYVLSGAGKRLGAAGIVGVI
jgi:hypothetical protein